ncbi:MAG: hypothetical protein UU87_C0003G0027 [Parcubacteria group bacterium GW2011_GWA2_42_11]|nr:MAG: hypothetical protein UU87_C0003G0027 [Parcubacteria group bacterium GW2011_GWA2_42_11]
MDIKNPANIQVSSPNSNSDDKNSVFDLNSQFMIRTMKNDLEALSNEKPPTAMPLPSIAPAVKKPPTPPAQVKPVTASPVAPSPKPFIPPSSPALKSAAPPVDLPISPPKPVFSPFTEKLNAEILKTENQNKKEPLPPAPKPITAIEPISVLREKETYPPATKTSKIYKIIFIFGGLLILTAAVIGFFIWQQSQPSTSPSPKPSASVTPSQTPPVRKILLEADSQRIIGLQADQKIKDALLASFLASPSPANSLTEILIEKTGGQTASTAYLNLAQIDQELKFYILEKVGDQLSGQSNLFIWTQTEGLAETAIKDVFRPVLIAELSTAASSTTVMETIKLMEPDMLSAFVVLTGKGLPDKKSFLDNIYKNVTIRYINLPDSSLTIDYAIVDRLLLITTSKASMYAVIDRLQNTTQ